MDRNSLTGLQHRIDHQFKTLGLLQQALTHRSFSADHNERLEFLGDAVLGLAIAGLLYDELQGHDEGDLSRVRASLVRQDSLVAIALSLGLPPLLRLGDGETRSGGQKRPSILADALEAIVGAVYLDAGYSAAQAVVRKLFANIKVDERMQGFAKDAKTQLQEWLQARKMQPPQYKVINTHGAAHQQLFEVECKIGELEHRQVARGPSRRAAEQAAAMLMLSILKVNS